MDRRHPGRQYMRAANFAPQELVRAIASRLGPICAHFPPEEFANMVQRIAHIQWKYEQRDRPDSLGRHP